MKRRTPRDSGVHSEDPHGNHIEIHPGHSLIHTTDQPWPRVVIRGRTAPRASRPSDTRKGRAGGVRYDRSPHHGHHTTVTAGRSRFTRPSPAGWSGLGRATDNRTPRSPTMPGMADAAVANARTDAPGVAWRPLLALSAAVAALLIAVSGRYGYHRDELYFLPAGRHLGLGLPGSAPARPGLGPAGRQRRSRLAGRAAPAVRADGRRGRPAQRHDRPRTGRQAGGATARGRLHDGGGGAPGRRASAEHDDHRPAGVGGGVLGRRPDPARR